MFSSACSLFHSKQEIVYSFTGQIHKVLIVYSFTGQIHKVLIVYSFTGQIHKVLIVYSFTGQIHKVLFFLWHPSDWNLKSVSQKCFLDTMEHIQQRMICFALTLFFSSFFYTFRSRLWGVHGMFSGWPVWPWFAVWTPDWPHCQYWTIVMSVPLLWQSEKAEFNLSVHLSFDPLFNCPV